MVIGLAQDTSAMTALAQSARRGQQGIQIAGITPGREQDIQRHAMTCPLSSTTAPRYGNHVRLDRPRLDGVRCVSGWTGEAEDRRGELQKRVRGSHFGYNRNTGRPTIVDATRSRILRLRRLAGKQFEGQRPDPAMGRVAVISLVPVL